MVDMKKKNIITFIIVVVVVVAIGVPIVLWKNKKDNSRL